MQKQTILRLAKRAIVCQGLVILFLLVGPLVLLFGIQGDWLLILPLVSYLARLTGYYVFPPLACLAVWWAVRAKAGLARREKGILAIFVVVTVLTLGLAIAIDQWQHQAAKRTYEAKFGKAPPDAVVTMSLVGHSIPVSLLTTFAGESVRLSEMIQTHEMTLIVFWQSYNTPWSGNMRIAKELHSGFSVLKLGVIGINVEEPRASAEKYIRGSGVKFPVLRDADGSYFRSLRVMGSVEQSIIVDKTGKIVLHFPRALQSEEKVVSAIKEILSTSQ